MTDTVSLLVAVPAAILGAAGFGMSSAAQQRATHEVPVAPTLSPRLLVELARHPWWLLGLGTTVLALAMQLVALAFGPLTIVQPLLVTGCVFAGVFAALLHHRAPDRWVVGGGLLTAAGLAGFLLLARPVAAGPNAEHLDVTDNPTFLVTLVVVLAGCLVWAGVSTHPSRVLALALGTGILFGVTAALMKAVTTAVRGGAGELFTTPALYAACVIGPMGFLLSQNTFQQGRLVSPSVAVITTADPIVAVFAGIAWLGESIDTSWPLLVGQIVSGVVVLAGIASVTLRSTILLRRGTAPEDAAAWEARDP
ncbi:DMT family transporter [Actinomycetospora chiangmaiensis]|uniref:DMT family transporter n=1 Tax=Actinomycetospora chiangmaiensis TaxID=402650 RepID=UPI000374B068|nr:DMT family transporter [Actinomycetospora chiangmaiensis]